MVVYLAGHRGYSGEDDRHDFFAYEVNILNVHGRKQ